jgi:autotransporter-associated beta strand protein
MGCFLHLPKSPFRQVSTASRWRFFAFVAAVSLAACTNEKESAEKTDASEPEVTLSAFTWKGDDGGDLLEGSNYAGGEAPGPEDVVIFMDDANVTVGEAAAIHGIEIQSGSVTLSLTQDLEIEESLTLSADASLNKEGAGTLTISGVQNHALGASVTVLAGELIMGTDPGSVDERHLSLAASGATASIVFLSSQHLLGLSLDDAAQAEFASGGSKMIVLTALSLDSDGGAALDLIDNDLVLDFSGAADLAGAKSAALANIRSLLLAGSEEASWNGSGLMSSAAHANSLTLGATALGYASNNLADFGVGLDPEKLVAEFNGEAVPLNAILVKYTYAGDVDLDGTLTATDYFVRDTNEGATNVHWFMGDVTYDGLVDSGDAGLMDYVFEVQGDPL